MSDATVKRWEDAGRLKSERTNGGHRRFLAEEVARFQLEANIGLKRNHGDESLVKINLLRQNSKFPLASPLFISLLNGCETESANLIIGEHLQKKSPAKIFDEFICPTMREIGELWAKGEISVAEEHLATRTVYNAIHKFRGALPVPAPTQKLAICCAVENDFHDLPTFLTQIVLENEGWEVMNFGANTPLDCLAKEVLKHQPDALFIAATFIENVEKFAENYKIFTAHIEKTKTPVIFGGKSFLDKSIRKFFPKTISVNSFSELAKFARKA